MTPERWKQVEELFHAALERDEAERAPFLDQACAGDDELRREVESLLVSAAAAGDVIEAQPQDVAAQLMTEGPSPLMIGRRFSRYRVISFLGAGGMGEVYLAQDLSLGRKAAIKLLSQKFTQDRDLVQRFRQEAKAASALNHPNIITIFEIGQDDELLFIATEFIDGQTLRQRISDAPLNLRESLDIMAQTAGALTAAHEAGIVHRDIKPENIMIRRDGYVKVLDFGLAKLIESHQTENASFADAGASNTRPVLTDPRQLIGTPRYMSPEQLRMQQVDGRSDIFSLGITLYDSVTGRAPFEGASPFEIATAILSEEPAQLSRYSQGIPAELKRIVNRALKKNREERYQTAGDLLADLKNLKLDLEMEEKFRRAGQAEPQTETAPSIDLPPALPGAADSAPSSQKSLGSQLEPVGGAVPLGSKFYIVRPTDHEFQSAIARQDSVVLVKGARQVGKTSLLARGLQQARDAGARVVITDFQKLSASYLESVEKLLLTLAESFCDQLELDVFPNSLWNSNLSPGINFERYLRRAVGVKVPSPIVWGLDEVDRLFTCDFGSEVFGLFRSWHNERALDPQGPWGRFTLAIAYATEAHLFITDLNQSPFNVGTRLALGDFTFEQVAELNSRHGSPLRDRAETARFYRMVGGHPYLVRRGLHEMAVHNLKLSALEAEADQDEGPFGDHLRRILVSLIQDESLCETVRGLLQGQPLHNTEGFYRLRSAGLMVGDSMHDVRPRCQIYATFLERHLL